MQPAPTSEAPASQQLQQLFLHAQPHTPAADAAAAPFAAEWLIPPQQWRKHPTLLSGCGATFCSVIFIRSKF